ncbi:MAG: hypothetical protein HFJ02_00475 [Bacilli bacterium]|nr:hypothetical protein [Bacilli bacterium]
MYCKKCGENIQKDWNYCPKCKSNLQNGNREINKEIILEQKKNEKKKAFICLCGFFIGIIGTLISNHYKDKFFFISLISIVNGFIKYPTNKLIKILFWLFLIGIIIYALIIIFILFTCGKTLIRWRW